MVRARIVTVFLTLMLAAAVAGTAPALADSHTDTVNLRVDGMVCPLCEQTVEAVVGDLPGIATVDANYRTSTVIVTYEPAKVTPDAIVDQINTQTYYEARVTSEFIKTATFEIPGLDTQAEADAVDQALRNVSGIVGGTLQIGSLTVDYDQREISPQRVVDAINTQTSLTATASAIPEESAETTGPTGTAVIRIDGMTDDQAASQVTGALLLDGIVDGTVDTDDATLTIIYDTDRLTAQRVVDTLRQTTPYGVTLLSDEASAGSSLTSLWVVLALALSTVTAVISWPALKRRYSPAAPPEQRATTRASRKSEQHSQKRPTRR